MNVLQSTYDEIAASESRLLAALRNLKALAYAYSPPDDSTWNCVKDEVENAISLSIGIEP